MPLSDLIIAGALLFASKDDYEKMAVTDLYAMIIFLTGIVTTGNHLMMAFPWALIALFLSYWPQHRPCWGLGDGLLIASLCFCCPPPEILRMIVCSTATLGLYSLVLGIPIQQRMPLVPFMTLSWLLIKCYDAIK